MISGSRNYWAFRRNVHCEPCGNSLLEIMLRAMTMKSSCLVLAAVAPMLLVACSPTDAEAGQTLSPEISKAVLDWSSCRSSKVGVLLPSQRGAEDIVDEAFRECAGFEAETIRIWEEVYGQGTANQVEALRQRWRVGIIDQVNAARNSSTVSDPFGAWGRCVGRNIPELVPADVSSELIADNAFESCRSDLEKVREGISIKYGVARADSDIERLRLEIREKTIAMIDAKRHIR